MSDNLTMFKASSWFWIRRIDGGFYNMHLALLSSEANVPAPPTWIGTWMTRDGVAASNTLGNAHLDAYLAQKRGELHATSFFGIVLLQRCVGHHNFVFCTKDEFESGEWRDYERNTPTYTPYRDSNIHPNAYMDIQFPTRLIDITPTEWMTSMFRPIKRQRPQFYIRIHRLVILFDKILLDMLTAYDVIALSQVNKKYREMVHKNPTTSMMIIKLFDDLKTKRAEEYIPQLQYCDQCQVRHLH